MSLFHELDQSCQRGQEILVAIQRAVLALPENPRVQKLAARCQVAMLADLRQHGWDPATHDFAQQYRMVADCLGRVRLEDVHHCLSVIVVSGFVPQPAPQRKFRLHPTVQQHLQTLLNSDWIGSEAQNVPESGPAASAAE